MAKPKLVESLFSSYAEELAANRTPDRNGKPRTEITLWQLVGHSKEYGQLEIFAKPVPKGALGAVERIIALYDQHAQAKGCPPLFDKIVQHAVVVPIKVKLDELGNPVSRRRRA